MPAPAGVSSSSRRRPPPACTDRQALSESGRLWDSATTEWELIVRHDISNALPLTRPLQLRRDVDLGDGIYLCGDHQDTSIQGAMARIGRRDRVGRFAKEAAMRGPGAAGGQYESHELTAAGRALWSERLRS